MDLLGQAVKEKGKAQVANELAISRTTVHMVLAGTYRAATTSIEKKVLAAYGKAICPFLGRVLAAADCAWYRERPVPMNHHDELAHWKACQECEAPIVPEVVDPDGE
jgi:hypothetical protein